MLKIKLVLCLKDEPVQLGEFSTEFMSRVQRRAVDARFWLGWLPGIRTQVLEWTWAQKSRFDALDRVYRSAQ